MINVTGFQIMLQSHKMNEKVFDSSILHKVEEEVCRSCSGIIRRKSLGVSELSHDVIKRTGRPTRALYCECLALILILISYSSWYVVLLSKLPSPRFSAGRKMSLGPGFVCFEFSCGISCVSVGSSGVSVARVVYRLSRVVYRLSIVFSLKYISYLTTSFTRLTIR